MKLLLLLLLGVAALAGSASVSRSPETAAYVPATASAGPPSAADLDSLLAPVALYPDQLLAQILLCAANPGKVATLNEWLRSHETLQGTDLQDAAVAAGFDDSFAALVLFPDVVTMMASKPEWTGQVGAAFAADRGAVFDSIQRLRAKAQKTGALKTTPQQDVETRTTSSGGSVIVIEPSNPQVVYVPQYNPQVVYTQPATVVVEKDSSADAATAGAIIGFAAGIAIGAAIDNDNYYGPYGWHGGAYMYNDGWDDWYDAREDAREDWQDHREDIVEDRGERAKTQQEQRTERQQTTQEQRTERQQSTQQQRTDRQQTRSEARPESQTSATPQGRTGTTQESRGYSGDARTSRERAGTSSDAFSGYSNGKSERAASARGQKSRSSSRSGGSKRRR